MMMHSCAYQQNHHQHHQIRRGDTGLVSLMPSDGVVCPKPRRIGTHLTPSSPFLHHINNQPRESYDSNAGNELLDIILNKGAYGGEKSNFQVASSPPFFSGSPPSRASNPVVQDEQFINNKHSPYPSMFEPPPSPSSRMSSGGGCVRVKYGHSSTPVRRVEGFNCRISAFA